MEELVIIDYNSCEVHIYRVNSDINIDSDFIKSLGYNPDECSWMFGESIGIIKHKEIV